MAPRFLDTLYGWLYLTVIIDLYSRRSNVLNNLLTNEVNFVYYSSCIVLHVIGFLCFSKCELNLGNFVLSKLD